MPFCKTVSFTALVVGLALASAQAQTRLTVTDAELAVPFGAAKGHMATLEDQMVFVVTENPETSLAIDRADITNMTRSGDVITVTTRRALRDANGERDLFRFRMSQPGDLMGWYESTSAAAPVPATEGPEVLASFQAKHDHRIGSCLGTVILTTERVSFESSDEIDDSRQWQLADVKKVEQSGAYKLRVEPFVGESFNFELTGKGMDTGEFRRLVDRIARARSTS